MKPKILRSVLLQQGIPVPHAFTLRDTSLPGLGNASLLMGDRSDTILTRRSILHELDLPLERLTLAHQEHSNRILCVDQCHAGHGSLDHHDCLGPADGLLTAAGGVAVGVLVADCCCLLMADLEGKVVGAIHAGWRGTHAGIAACAVKAFQSAFGISPGRLRVWISPSITEKNYQVSEDVWSLVRDQWGEGDYLHSDPFRIDLPLLNREQLLREGVPPEQIEISGICTYDSMQCFSHRRGDHPQGRMLGAISPANGFSI